MREKLIAIAGVTVLVLACGGVALGRGTSHRHKRPSTHASKPPAIHLSAPTSVAADSTYSIQVWGYFNNRTHGASHPGANVAFVAEANGYVNCSLKNLEDAQLGWRSVAGGPADKKLRAKTPTTPGHFSATENVTSPGAGGQYTLCASLVNYPYGYRFKQTAGVHISVQPPVLHTLTVAVTGASDGEVDGYTDAESGSGSYSIQCAPGKGETQCSHGYAPGTVVHLSQTSSSLDTYFMGWSRACSGTAELCDVTMNADESVGATFGQAMS